jgi:diadenosine tetraphosphate (Ap4A) HIT family hydrolase
MSSGCNTDSFECRVCAEASLSAAELRLQTLPRALSMVPEKVRVAGSVVVVPFRHVSSFVELDETEVREVAELVHDAATRILAAFRADGLNVWWATGALAGQVEPHFFVELVPRFVGVPYK